jgi:hypothetical protein
VSCKEESMSDYDVPILELDAFASVLDLAGG